jgi:hypothetical protein
MPSLHPTISGPGSMPGATVIGGSGPARTPGPIRTVPAVLRAPTHPPDADPVRLFTIPTSVAITGQDRPPPRNRTSHVATDRSQGDGAVVPFDDGTGRIRRSS